MAKEKISFTHNGITFTTADKVAKKMVNAGNISGAVKRLAGQSAGAKLKRAEERRAGIPNPQNTTEKVLRQIYNYKEPKTAKAYARATEAKHELIKRDFMNANIPQAFFNAAPGELASKLENLSADYASRYRPGDSMRFNNEARKLIDDYYGKESRQTEWKQMEKERLLYYLEEAKDAYELKHLRR